MASPDTTLAVRRNDLAASMEEFDLEMDRRGFIAHRVCPTLQVAVQAGRFGKIPIEQLLQNRDTERAPGSGYARGSFTFTHTTFATVEHGAEEPVDDREAEMYADYLDAELLATQRAIDVVLRNAEKRVEAMIYNATTWTGASLTTAITHEWDDATNAVPITDVEAAARKVWGNSGLWPNALIINRKVFRNLRLSDQIRDRITSDGAGSSELAGDITVAQIARAFDLDYILVGGSPENTAKEGQSVSISPIWSDEYAMVCKIATTNDVREPCIGRAFHWGVDGSMSPDGNPYDAIIESYRDEGVRSDIIRARRDSTEIVMYTEAGHMLSNVTT